MNSGDVLPAGPEFVADDLLDNVVRLDVHAGRGLVQADDPRQERETAT
jgi:hypothetical protein